ncbi:MULTISPECIES: serine hydrolase domain-containing protein [Catenuloplanes]|uniref:CubicO group peptidase (Beta-lactamase class C family) n=1 Tax=Catenuloplanes niger TaxID=587534 RepID=A0AAE3ZZP9_9ACTN|nr:serine hydrolase domain-containing protein [Catenuloplanes niger]MDR7327786.1 CubicO group peptidase (beta-lactamase class C family) [Catenuloplanes niger]
MLTHVIAALALAIAVPALPATRAGAVGVGVGATAAVDGSAIDAAVRAYRDATRIPGIAVAVVRGRTVLHAAGYGRTAAGAPVTDRTVLPIASLSKSVTALAVMQLVESGRIRLDAPVHDQLPEFTMADERAATITVRQLLDHTSGMSDTTYRPVSGHSPTTPRELVASMRGARLAADPGSRFEYHNPNYQVAARLVEVAGGQDFQAYLHEHVFAPLGMTDSRTVDTARDLPSGDGPGHRMLAGIALAVPEPPAFGNGSGGVLSTARDMAAWLIAQNGQGRGPDGTAVVSAATIAAMHRPAAHRSYALGWTTGTTDSGTAVVDHTGGLITITAYQALLPHLGYGIVVVSNAGSQYGDAPDLGARLIDLIEGRQQRPLPTPVPLICADLATFLLTAGTVTLAIRGIRRSPAWARSHRLRRPATVLRLLPYLIPALALAVPHRVVSWLYRGSDISWVQAGYLYPAGTLLLLTTAVACLAVLGTRLLHATARTRAGTGRGRGSGSGAGSGSSAGSGAGSSAGSSSSVDGIDQNGPDRAAPGR